MRNERAERVAVALATGLALAACGGEGGGGGEGGERVGEGATPPAYRVWAPGAFVGRFPPNPYDPEAEFLIETAYGMAVSGELDGVFIHDQPARQVLHVGRDAKLRAVLGRRGGGPGEIEIIGSVERHPDGGAWVTDAGSTRASWFDADGTLIEEWDTPWPIMNFGTLTGGRLVSPSNEREDFLAVHDAAGHRALDFDRAVVPPEASDFFQRFARGAMRFLPAWPDALLFFVNRSGEQFGAWRLDLDVAHTRVEAIAAWPLTEWIDDRTRDGGGSSETQRSTQEVAGVRTERVHVTETPAFKSVRLVEGEVWLVPNLIPEVLAVSMPLEPTDSASVVLPPEPPINCLLDVAVLHDRIAMLCPTELRIYELNRVPAESFSIP